MRRFIDIGANLTDSMFSGMYNGSRKHAPDIDQVLSRAFNHGIEKIIVTAVGCKQDIVSARALCCVDTRLYYTVGCHPTRCGEFAADPDQYYADLMNYISEGGSRVVAVGECGLDYDRVHFCPKNTQLSCFQRQLDLASETRLPLFLHCRNAFEDLINSIQRHIERFGPIRGVVHTFDGTEEQAKAIINLGFYIGLNGCSLKTKRNLEVVASLPSEKILLETDAPWCEIRPTHAGFQHVVTRFAKKKPSKWESGYMVTGRNEPANIIQVLEVVAGVRGQPLEDLAHVAYENSLSVFSGLLNSR
ncbi:unnamed protein product [Hydatigera taeniaeformis]|uniref:Deoxyribonuclease TATDN1 n=1 Tax=Hydatigena taeniaeformis TaxID=6205 RepID=A0A0R3WS74_HYDTA|nr:unnamed protein product [Hydatigera taeniaeformis]